VISEGMEGEVEDGIRKFHSPEQISGRLKKEGVRGPGHQTIYDHTARDRKAEGDLYRSLGHRGKHYPRKHTKAAIRGKIAGRTGIEEHPKAANNRSRYGDWEAISSKEPKGQALFSLSTSTKPRPIY